MILQLLYGIILYQNRANFHIKFSFRAVWGIGKATLK